MERGCTLMRSSSSKPLGMDIGRIKIARSQAVLIDFVSSLERVCSGVVSKENDLSLVVVGNALGG